MADFADGLLKIGNSPVLSQFLHDCVDDLVGAKQANFDSYNSDIEWTSDDFTKTKHFIQKFYRESVINDNFELTTDLGEKIRQEIENCFKVRKNDIFQAMITEKMVENGHNLVENFDWRLKWILGSSTMASLRDPLLQLDLHCIKRDEEKGKTEKNTINCEMNLENLENLIEQLQKVKNDLHPE